MRQLITGNATSFPGYGFIWHYNGSNWSSEDLGTSPMILDMWGSSATDIFAVGTQGTILHYNGTKWSPQTSGTTHNLQAVWGTSPLNVYTVDDWGIAYHFDGFSWSPIYDQAPAGSIWGTSADNIFLGGGLE